MAIMNDWRDGIRGLKGSLTDLGYKIFLDRYALKDQDRSNIMVGSIVVVMTDSKTGQREIGCVSSVGNGSVTVELYEGGSIQQALEHVDLPLELNPMTLMGRVSEGIAQAEETEEKKEEWTRNFRWLLDDWKFVPGGRILAGAGTDQNLTFYNCYVIPSPKDSRHGIVDTLGQMMEIMSRGGGVGINISSLRPAFSYVKGVNGRSSGSVSWGTLYSFVTGLIEQGGSRRGALMLILNDWHPDLLDFIDSKRKAGHITNANISVAISDSFMKAVENDEDWGLLFPDTTDPDYDALWDGDLNKWMLRGKPTTVHKTLRAREIWNRLIESAWASAEPGVFFVDRYNAMSNSYYYAPINCTNPCGEQGLPPWGVCNLGAINLAKFVRESTEPNANRALVFRGVRNGYEVDWESLRRAVRYGVRFLDNVIDSTPYFFEKNAERQLRERRVGLGTMGLGEMLIKLGIRYGSKESESFIDSLYTFIAVHAYYASADNAQEKGPFPSFDSDKFLESGYMKSMTREVREVVKQKGIRNVTLLTQAPTGTTGTMMDTSTGIEPFYSWTFTRKGRLGVHEETVKIAQEWRENHPGQFLPDYFVTAMDLTPEEHIRVEAAIQRWIDSSISKTANLPADYTIEQTRELYELMYRLGCKGGTVYRDTSRDEQVLMLKKEDTTQPAQPVPTTVAKTGPERRRLPEERQAITHKFVVGEQEGYITVGLYPDGSPGEVFLRVSKQGSTVSGLTEDMGLLISIALQYGVPLEGLANKMKNSRFEPAGVTNNPEIKFATSIVDYIFRWMDQRFFGGKQAPPSEQSTKVSATVTGMGCPTCGELMHYASGCLECQGCGYSKCG
jgi:ribonucleoside-diphosphate reductase alpha chain